MTLSPLGAMVYHRRMKRLSHTISLLLLLCFCAFAQSTADRGVARDGLYTNQSLGFSFKYPKDWVVHGEETKQRLKEIGKEKITKSGGLSEAATEVSLNNTHNLLTLFRYAVGTPGITFNPGIIVIAERVGHAPGITNGKDYLLNARMILQRSGGQVPVEEPKEYSFGGSQFFRDNYTTEVHGVTVVQSHFVLVTKGYALAFIFMGPDQKSVDEMATAMETFALAPPIRRGVTGTIDGAPPRKPK